MKSSYQYVLTTKTAKNLRRLNIRLMTFYKNIVLILLWFSLLFICFLKNDKEEHIE